MGEGEGGMGEGERGGSKREGEAGGGKRGGEEELGGGEQSRARAHYQPRSQTRHPPPTTRSPKAASACGPASGCAHKARRLGAKSPGATSLEAAWHARPVSLRRLGVSKRRKVQDLPFLHFEFNLIMRSDFKERGGGGRRDVMF